MVLRPFLPAFTALISALAIPLSLLGLTVLALALLAVDNARLQWLDQGLVRRPRRSPGQASALQQDLATHYRELMTAVRSSRAAQGLADPRLPSARELGLA